MEWKYQRIKNIIERSVILTDGSELTVDSLPVELQKLNTDKSKGKFLSAFDLASAEKSIFKKC